MRFLLILFIASTCSACSVATRARGRCPSLAPLLGDFVLGGAALGAGVDRFNEGESAQALALVGVAAVIGLSANLSECR